MRTIAVILLLGFLASCSERDDSPIDFTGLPPFLSEATISPEIVNSDTIQTGTSGSVTISLLATARVEDPNGFQDIARVEYAVMKPGESQASFRGELGIPLRDPPVPRVDGQYEGPVVFTIDESEIGRYTIEFFATDQSGLISNAVQRRLSVVRLQNSPPVISNLQARDTVTITDPHLIFTISIQADDPEGLADIDEVQFNSFKPDGSGATNNPFQMFDDGSENQIFPAPVFNSGDAVKGDGIYSLKLILFPNDPSTGVPTQRGDYRFEFQAFDKSGTQSNMIIHIITVL